MLTILLLSAIPTASYADVYMAVEGTVFRIDDSDAPAAGEDTEFNPLGVRLRAGLRLSELFDVEAQVSFSSDDEDERLDRLDVRTAGAHLKAYLPVGRRSAAFALAGYSVVDYEQHVAGRLIGNSQSGLSWGVGLETELADNVDLTADYMNYVQRDGLFDQVSSVNAGLKFYF